MGRRRASVGAPERLPKATDAHPFSFKWRSIPWARPHLICENQVKVQAATIGMTPYDRARHIQSNFKPSTCMSCIAWGRFRNRWSLTRWSVSDGRDWSA